MHLSGRGYVFTWLGLVALTLGSFGFSRLGFESADLPVALAIAATKATLVLLFFMHLIEQRFANQLVVIVSFVLIAILCALIATDVATRHTFPRGPEPPIATQR